MEDLLGAYGPKVDRSEEQRHPAVEYFTPRHHIQDQGVLSSGLEMSYSSRRILELNPRGVACFFLRTSLGFRKVC